MTREELEILQEIEKDFDKETARRVYEAGYRKVFNKYTCQRCGKRYMGHSDKTLHTVRYFTDANGLTMGNFRLCPSCWLVLCKQRDKVDDKFFSELKPNGKAD